MLTAAWKAGNRADRVIWDRQVQSDADAAAAREQEARDRLDQQEADRRHEDDTAKAEDHKKNRSKYLELPDVPPPITPPEILPAYALSRLQKGQFVELWPRPWPKNRQYGQRERDDTQSVEPDGSVTWTPAAAARTATREVKQDRDLTWEQFLVAYPRYLDAIEAADWTLQRQEMMRLLFQRIQAHPLRFTPDEGDRKALLRYICEQRQLWHRAIDSPAKGAGTLESSATGSCCWRSRRSAARKQRDGKLNAIATFKPNSPSSWPWGKADRAREVSRGKRRMTRITRRLRRVDARLETRAFPARGTSFFAEARPSLSGSALSASGGTPTASGGVAPTEPGTGTTPHLPSKLLAFAYTSACRIALLRDTLSGTGSIMATFLADGGGPWGRAGAGDVRLADLDGDFALSSRHYPESVHKKGWGWGGKKGWTSDSGWGCMLRTGQSLLANALVFLYLGHREYFLSPLYPSSSSSTDWRRPPYAVHTADYAMYVQILTWFLDTPSPEAPFSVHRMALAGKELGKDVGQWFGPSTAAGAIKTLVHAFPESTACSIRATSLPHPTPAGAASTPRGDMPRRRAASGGIDPCCF
ncbi:hypothetical protein H0H92_007893 [Tricholoma furcatifolium]|nr:hypothetical protein H0H92_007893 [Tricholoma furcatifolium]